MRFHLYRRLILGTVLFLPLSLAILAPLSGKARAADETIVVYTARNEPLIKPVFDAYAKATGVEIKFITDEAGPLLQRLIAEGEHTPADLLITVDAGNLWQASEKGLLQALHSPLLEANIPAHLRDPDGHWFGLSVRARTIVYNTRKVKPSELSTYEDLGGTKWNKRLCLRTSKKVYNQSLVAMMISELGIEKTEAVVKLWVNNLATDVFANDTMVMEAIAAGRCDVGIVNTYYYGRLLAKDPEVPLALFWPNQNNRGVHVNVSGAGVIKHSKHPKAAIRFLEWLSTGEAQNLFAGVNLEYPANPGAESDPRVLAWGSFKQDLINVSRAGELQSEAVKLMDRAGYR
jgi:iron(III) transport system substrate-binding protein